MLYTKEVQTVTTGNTAQTFRTFRVVPAVAIGPNDKIFFSAACAFTGGSSDTTVDFVVQHGFDTASESWIEVLRISLTASDKTESGVQTEAHPGTYLRLKVVVAGTAFTAYAGTFQLNATFPFTLEDAS